MISQTVLLLRNDARRVASAIQNPRPGVWIGILLPVTLIVGALWTAGGRAAPDLEDPRGLVLVGLVTAALPAFQAYPVLFRAEDDALLRRLGISARAIFALRALRLLLLAMLGVLAVLIPFAASGAGIGQPFLVGAGAAFFAWAAALFALSGAARSLSDPRRRRGLLSRSIRFDSALAAVAPLVFAPLVPLLGGAFAAGFLGLASSPGVAMLRAGALIGVSLVLASVAAMRFARAHPRFAPQAAEMAFAPAPAVGETGLVTDRGLARLLPGPAAAVRARDAVIAERRFRWATGIIWPVALTAGVALARWGDQAGVRTWVLLAGGLALLAQGGAVVALGRIERAGTRWIDRAAGVGWRARWVGRWAFGFGLSLWLTIPLALVWGWWVPTSPGWPWLLAGGVVAVMAASASLAAAGR